MTYIVYPFYSGCQFGSTRTWKCIVGLLVIPLLLLVVVAVPVCYHYVWSPLSHISSHNVQLSEGSIPILDEINSFLTQKVIVRQENIIDDSLHNISVYFSDSACGSLPTATTVDHHNDVHSRDIQPVYMMEGSIVYIYVCATTERHESNILFLYMLRSVEEFLAFDPHHLDKMDSFIKLPVGVRGSPLCSPLTIKIQRRNYYSFKFYGSDDISVTYNVTMTVKQLDISAINATLVGVFKPKNNEKEKAVKTISFGTGKKCLFADVQETSLKSTNNYTTLETHLEPRYSAALGITITMILLFALLTFVIEVFACFLFRKVCCRPDQPVSKYNTLE